MTSERPRESNQRSHEAERTPPERDAPPAPRLEPGTFVGPYRVERLLAVGGMGEVYRARDTTLGRDVAIKVLPPGFSADPERVRRFEQEAYAVSALNHPNIITIYDFGRSDDLHFIVTELIEGKTLRAYLNDSQRDWRKSVLIATQVAGALNAAHTVRRARNRSTRGPTSSRSASCFSS